MTKLPSLSSILATPDAGSNVPPIGTVSLSGRVSPPELIASWMQTMACAHVTQDSGPLPAALIIASRLSISEFRAVQLFLMKPIGFLQQVLLILLSCSVN